LFKTLPNIQNNIGVIILGIVGGIASIIALVFYFVHRYSDKRKREEVKKKEEQIQQKQFEKQIEKQNEQIRIQQKQLLNTRFSSGIELLSNPNETVRIGGANNLYLLANEQKKDYLKPVCEILCGHIRTISSNAEYQEKYKEKPSSEMQAIINLLFKDKKDKSIFDDCIKNLERTFLYGVDFYRVSLSNVNFRHASLNKVNFDSTTLNKVNFNSAILGEVSFNFSRLSEVDFSPYKLLTGFNFNPTSLTKVMFNYAKLGNVSFQFATLRAVNFSDAELQKNVFFEGTVLENVCNEDITSKCSICYSLDLT